MVTFWSGIRHASFLLTGFQGIVTMQQSNLDYIFLFLLLVLDILLTFMAYIYMLYVVDSYIQYKQS